MLETLKNKINNLIMKLNILLSRWLSRCILRVTSEDIKLKFRQSEKCKLKNIKEKSHQVFNEKCLNNLLPVYTNIYIYIYICVYVCVCLIIKKF